MQQLKTELKTMTGYVQSEGEKDNVSTPTFTKLLAELEKKSGRIDY